MADKVLNKTQTVGKSNPLGTLVDSGLSMGLTAINPILGGAYNIFSGSLKAIQDAVQRKRAREASGESQTFYNDTARNPLAGRERNQGAGVDKTVVRTTYEDSPNSFGIARNAVGLSRNLFNMFGGGGDFGTSLDQLLNREVMDPQLFDSPTNIIAPLVGEAESMDLNFDAAFDPNQFDDIFGTKEQILERSKEIKNTEVPSPIINPENPTSNNFQMTPTIAPSVSQMYREQQQDNSTMFVNALKEMFGSGPFNTNAANNISTSLGPIPNIEQDINTKGSDIKVPFTDNQINTQFRESESITPIIRQSVFSNMFNK